MGKKAHEFTLWLTKVAIRLNRLYKEYPLFVVLIKAALGIILFLLERLV